MFDTQNFPWNAVGPLSKRPPANGIQQGYTYFAVDARQGFILVIDPYTKVRTWHQLFGDGGPIKFSGGIAVNNKFTVGDLADVSNGASSAADEVASCFPTDRTVRHMCVNVPVNASTLPTDVEVYKNGIATGMKVTVPALTTGVRPVVNGNLSFLAGIDTLSVRMTNAGVGDLGPHQVNATVVLDAV